jgi:hypothetical protein
MTTRTSQTTVTFRRPFVVDGWEGVWPPGSYVVETEEELLETLLHAAWKRTSTVMLVKKDNRIEYVPIQPDQLGDALLRDGADRCADVFLSRSFTRGAHETPA